MTAVKQAIILIILAVLLGCGINLISPHKIAFIGDYRELSSGEGPIVPPSAQLGDPPFIAIDVAQMEYTTNSAIFIDARSPEEFACGTIPGAINIPFEYLPADLEAYLDSVLAGIPKDTGMVVFCSGEECDLSLHLARNLQDFGYSNVEIFFGGAREWEKFGLRMERRDECG
jgi:3-mercaptopyruvate sulfurtransferase SseA